MGKLRNFVRTKTLKTGGMNFRKWEDWKEGDFVIGQVDSFRTDNFDKENLLIRVFECSWDKELEEKVLNLNHCGSLEKAYVEIKEMVEHDGGAVVQVTYTGKTVIASGKFKGKSAHTLDVAVMKVEEEGEVL